MADVVDFPPPGKSAAPDDPPDDLLVAADAALDEYHGHGDPSWRACFTADEIEELRADMLRAIAAVVCLYNDDLEPDPEGVA